MSTMLQQAQQVAGEELKRVRWALGISGALSVLFGVAIIVWPSISLSPRWSSSSVRSRSPAA